MIDSSVVKSARVARVKSLKVACCLRGWFAVFAGNAVKGEGEGQGCGPA